MRIMAIGTVKNVRRRCAIGITVTGNGWIRNRRSVVKRKDVSMKIKYWLIGLLFLPMALMAQQKDLTLQDLIPGGKNYAKFVPKSLAQLQWNGDAYLYAKGDTVWTGEAPKWKNRCC